MANLSTTLVDFIAKNPGCTSEIIAEGLGLNRYMGNTYTSLMVLLKHLEKRKLIEIEKEPISKAPGCINRYFITDKTRKIISENGSFARYSYLCHKKNLMISESNYMINPREYNLIKCSNCDEYYLARKDIDNKDLLCPHCQHF